MILNSLSSLFLPISIVCILLMLVCYISLSSEGGNDYGVICKLHDETAYSKVEKDSMFTVTPFSGETKKVAYMNRRVTQVEGACKKNSVHYMYFL